MPAIAHNDLELTREEIQSLSSFDRLAAFFAHLGYPAETRLPMTAQALGLSADLARAVRHVERLTSLEAGALEIYLFELKSVTVGTTRALARTFRDRAGNYLLVLTDDYDQLDFVLLERVLPEGSGRGIGRKGITLRPRVLTVDRRNPDQVALRVLRRFTLTEFDLDGQPDPYAQYDKLQSAYVVAEWSEALFNNRALFSDYYLNQRLPDLPEWNDPARNQAFRTVRGLCADARRRFAGEDGPGLRQKLIRPVLEALGFRVETGPGKDGPDLRLFASSSPASQSPASFVLAYPWGRYLDGKDEARDAKERPEENPGIQVVSLLETGEAPWAIVTNGKTWRLYSARAHSRATNYYEIDLEETLASPDPAQAFRYFYLFFRAAAFAPEERLVGGETRSIGFVDWLLEESDTYAHELGERLKERVFEEIFPHFAEGFIQGLGGPKALLALSAAERAARLDDVFQGTLTFLYRLLFLLYAESRDLLPVREVRGYYEVSLQRLKEEVAAQAKTLEDQAPGLLRKAYTATDTILYDRLLDLFRVIDRGDGARNVPIYNGGLFLTEPDPADAGPDARNARFLLQTKLPDRHLALGLDRLARDLDPKRGDLAFIDYKSLGVRQLGSIYEGLLEFKVRLADQEMAVVKGKKTEEVLPHAEAKRQKLAVKRTLPRGTVYLENDRRERKATGSYYTPDYIVKYIVQNTVGPVLDEKFEALRPGLRQAEKRFRDTLQRKQAIEKVAPDRLALLTDIAGDVLRDMFDVKLLDPAMGSGHFLVEAVDYTTDRMVRFLDGFPFLSYFFEGMRRAILAEMERQAVAVDPARLTDVTLLKRHVLKRCIYGVDLNPMAVELAKVSLWLDCFTLGAPLSFLDHHLRCGNSLIGASARQAEADMAGPTRTGQMTFLTGPFVGLLRAAEIMRGISLLTDVTLSEVHQSEQLFREFDKAAKPYKQLLDVYVARHFGVKRADEFLRLYGVDAIQAGPDTVGEPFATALRETRRLYQEKRFFHWDLEFPEVFIDLARADWKQRGGFDAVVGNPPYVSSRNENIYSETRNYIRAAYTTAFYQVDLYYLFSEIASRLSMHLWAYVVPDTWLASVKADAFRKWICSNGGLSRLALSETPIFEATVDCLVVVGSRQSHPKIPVDRIDDHGNLLRVDNIDIGTNGSPIILSVGDQTSTTIKSIQELSVPLDSISYTGRGIGAYHHSKHSREIIETKAFHATFRKDSTYRPELRGESIGRFEVDWTDDNWISYGEWLSEPREPIFFTGPRLLCRKIIGSRLLCTFTEDDWLVNQQVYIACDFRHYDARGVAAIIASALIGFYARKLHHEEGLFPHLRVDQFRNLPIRRIHFTTPSGERQQRLAGLIAQYRQSQDAALLATVQGLLPKNEAGHFRAFAPNATGTVEKSDVVHDLLAVLAGQMIGLNKQKQAEQKRFLGWLEAALHIQPDRDGNAGVDALSGKTKLLGYLGDYQKDEPETPWNEVEDVLFKNKGRLGANLNDTRFLARLRDEYEKSLDTLRPIKAQLARTDRLIDQIVYRLYGLTEEEIAMVEGHG
jgi:hypothetical protein